MPQSPSPSGSPEPADHADVPRDDVAFMRKALELAERARGGVEPNPLVGAVLVRDGQTIGQGHHERFGHAHAEPNAIADARARGHDPKGATLYVTLEPCAHQGKTPPCTQAIIDAGITRVVAAMADPAPHAAGQGFERLRSAGIDVAVGVCERLAHQLNEPYLKRLRTGLPWVILKWAQTLDGHVATRTGHSQWISSEDSRRRVHELRARVDAIVVGIGTVLADDPLLTAREVELTRTARRVVVDPSLRIPLNARLLAGASDVPVLIATAQSRLDQSDEKVLELEAAGVGLLGLPEWAGVGAVGADDDSGRSIELDLEPLLRRLAEHYDASNVLVEGGPTLAGSFVSQGLADQALVFVAPRLLGDPDAHSAVRGAMCERIEQGQALELRSIERIADDVLLDYRIKPG